MLLSSNPLVILSTERISVFSKVTRSVDVVTSTMAWSAVFTPSIVGSLIPIDVFPLNSGYADDELSNSLVPTASLNKYSVVNRRTSRGAVDTDVCLQQSCGMDVVTDRSLQSDLYLRSDTSLYTFDGVVCDGTSLPSRPPNAEPTTAEYSNR